VPQTIETASAAAPSPTAEQTSDVSPVTDGNQEKLAEGSVKPDVPAAGDKAGDSEQVPVKIEIVVTSEDAEEVSSQPTVTVTSNDLVVEVQSSDKQQDSEPLEKPAEFTQTTPKEDVTAAIDVQPTESVVVEAVSSSPEKNEGVEADTTISEDAVEKSPEAAAEAEPDDVTTKSVPSVQTAPETVDAPAPDDAVLSVPEPPANGANVSDAVIGDVTETKPKSKKSKKTESSASKSGDELDDDAKKTKKKGDKTKKKSKKKDTEADSTLDGERQEDEDGAGFSINNSFLTNSPFKYSNRTV
jgi:hypothetical protein